MNQEKFLNFRKTYPTFYYRSYEVKEEEENFVLTYFFEIPSLAQFHPTIKIAKEKIQNRDLTYLSYLAFHIGLVELVSYWKCTCSPEVIIEACFLDSEQKDWFLKLYYWGLGEFRYVNGIECELSDWMKITSTGSKQEISISYEGKGNLLAIGGGKDSVVSLEILKNQDNLCFMVNPKEPGIACIKAAGIDSYLRVERTIDKELLRLNEEGFLNGHTPFSALLAFLSYLCAYLTNKKYIVLSNEGSANEATVLGTKINHQYSKTYEFESDFAWYAKKYLQTDIEYFSLLRCLSELQIAMLFAHYPQYHPVFKSCNVGSKSTPWKWCCNCPKCLFVFIVLSPFLKKEELISIFGENLYAKEELLPTFLELLGYREAKPFECVGTTGEVRFAVLKAMEQYKDDYLLKYYQEHYPLEETVDYRLSFNEENHIPEEYLKLVKEELAKYVS